MKFDQLEFLCYRQLMNRTTLSSTHDIALQLDSPDRLSAGKLCLEFANTSYWHASEAPVESVFSYNELIDWAVSVGIRSEESALSLKANADRHPALAEQIYAWAIELREAIYRIFVAIAEQEQPATADIDLLNEALPHAFTRPQIVVRDNGYGWHWRGDDSGLDAILWPILRSAARLLIDGEYSRIGQCADDRGCGYLFYDTSRNHTRRWCDMNSCGNRAKSQRHYARRRKNKQED
jgi:predicted RNA-binding Zn ribbon-like protein